MKKASKTLGLLMMLILSWHCLPAWTAADESAHPSGFQPLSKAPPPVRDAYDQVVRDFVLYERLLEAESLPDGSYELVNARTPAQARSFLEAGFTPDLADAICSLYTRWDSVRQRMLLIPQEGLPVLYAHDQSLVAFKEAGSQEIIFYRLYTDCFIPGDRYIFTVKASSLDGLWKINSLNLEPSPAV